MIGLKVSKNGKLLCTAGAEDLEVLETYVSALGALGDQTKAAIEGDSERDFFLQTGGLTSRRDRADEHLYWIQMMDLKLGDRIEIEIVDVASADSPSATSPKDKNATN